MNAEFRRRHRALTQGDADGPSIDWFYGLFWLICTIALVASFYALCLQVHHYRHLETSAEKYDTLPTLIGTGVLSTGFFSMSIFTLLGFNLAREALLGTLCWVFFGLIALLLLTMEGLGIPLAIIVSMILILILKGSDRFTPEPVLLSARNLSATVSSLVSVVVSSWLMWTVIPAIFRSMAGG